MRPSSNVGLGLVLTSSQHTPWEISGMFNLRKSVECLIYYEKKNSKTKSSEKIENSTKRTSSHLENLARSKSGVYKKSNMHRLRQNQNSKLICHLQFSSLCAQVEDL